MNFIKNFINKKVIKSLHSITELEEEYTLSNENITELRKKTKILIIDDDDIPVISDLISTLRYDITKMDDLVRLEDAHVYQIIVCDIHDVGKKFDNSSDLGGIELIKQLRKTYPNKYLIFFSSYNFDSTIDECFKIVDDNIQKKFDIKYLSEKLDNAIKDIYNPRTLWNKYGDYLSANKIPTAKIALIEDFYVQCIKDKGDFDDKSLRVLFDDNQKYIKSFSELVGWATTFIKLIGG